MRETRLDGGRNLYHETQLTNRVGVFTHLRTETEPVSETLFFFSLFRKNLDDGQSPKTQYLCVLYTIVRTL
jgi:hypothetical protein